MNKHENISENFIDGNFINNCIFDALDKQFTLDELKLLCSHLKEINHLGLTYY